MPSLSGRATPLPSFSTSNGPISQSSLFTALSAISSNSAAISEKVTLSSQNRLNDERNWLRRVFDSLYVILRVGINGRSYSIPVLRIFNFNSGLMRRNEKMGNKRVRNGNLFGILGTLLINLFIFILIINLTINLFPFKHKLPFVGESNTLIYNSTQIERIWKWEIANGRYPSTRTTDTQLTYSNPAIPSQLTPNPSLIAIGKPRQTLNIHSIPPSIYPPRPIPNSIIDLDKVMDHCDFTNNKYVRDCLEILRLNAGMDTNLRRGITTTYRINFIMPKEKNTIDRPSNSIGSNLNVEEILNSTNFDNLLAARTQLTLSPPSHRPPHATHPTADSSCDPDYPKLFHIFWAGPFTDKPYSAALSFLYTQRLGLEQPLSTPSETCRPQLWIWINPGPASSLPNPNAKKEMLADLRKNPWSLPFLNPRFSESIKFKLWNTTEQLDGIAEMKGWQEMRLFNSGGVKYGAEAEKKSVPVIKKEITLDADGLPPAAEVTDESDTSEDMIAEAELSRFNNATLLDPLLPLNTSTNSTILPPKKSKDVLFERLGSSSSSEYDRLSVVLSDMARFVLTHHYGGVYLDADTILLRDWEELFNWKGSFAYRWSRMKKYNTAVLKMSRGSALGNFIFKSAVANGLDFHPMTISRYTLDAKVEGLLLRLPDALFDPAWLNTEYYQTDRPPVPFFKRFEDFFETPKEIKGAPSALGFNGFFKGAFSYHFHNFWWIPFDQKRNFPDLGERFVAGERIARGRIHAAKLATATPPLLNPPNPKTKLNYQWGDNESDFDELDWSNESLEEDMDDLSWSAVLKRTFESYIRGERPNLYGEWIDFDGN